MMPVTCGVHPWMRAYVSAIAHPFFAVTDDKGEFTLRDVPPGTYQVEALQEVYGARSQQVQLKPKARETLVFAYTAVRR